MHIGEPWCCHCVDVVENTMHVLSDRPLAKSVWCNLLNNEARELFFTTAIDDWITLDLHQQLGRDSNINWASVWAASCYFLWIWRNRDVHGGSRLRPFQP
ncbi:hypothetical protein L195_g031914 [Trifolium pratense]|uniref:Reverse transcriptase zinc-binding domain-containing protein n=1 Tax=Trifolium pratense TaxID=57577 RepID=A0A2K3LBR1_TRIPR|nr:hypothetical protein L195_g031914 [Trifolium pratense]